MKTKYFLLVFALVLSMSSAFALNGRVINYGTYKEVCYQAHGVTYSMNITDHANNMRCSAVESSSERIRLICDSVFDGNGDGICHSGETCLGISFYDRHYDKVWINGAFTWTPSRWSETLDEYGTTQNRYKKNIFDEHRLGEGLYYKKLNQQVGGSCYCPEKWVCGSWSGCGTDEMRTRSCTDINSCGTTVHKPETSEVCCPETTSCSDWTSCNEINTTDYRICHSDRCGEYRRSYAEYRNCTGGGDGEQGSVPEFSGAGLALSISLAGVLIWIFRRK